MSFRTTAAARQNEMNVKATVVATTTFAELTFPDVSDVCIDSLNYDDAAAVRLQQAGQSGFSRADDDERFRSNGIAKRFMGVPAEQNAYEDVCFEPVEQAGHDAFYKIEGDRRLIEGQRIGNDLRSKQFEREVEPTCESGGGR